MGVLTSSAAIMGGLAADSQATVPTSLRESLGNLAWSGIGPSPTPDKASWSLSPVGLLLVAVSALVGLCLILFSVEPAIRTDSIVQLQHLQKTQRGGDPDTQTPLIGALTDAARLAGRNVDYAKLMGDSSLAFITRWYRLNAQPTVHQDASWDSVGYLVYAGNKELRLLGTSLGMSLQISSQLTPSEFDATGWMASIVAAIRAGECAVGYLASTRPEVDEGCSPAHVVLIVGADPAQQRLLLRCDDQERPTWHAVTDLAPRILIPRKNREPLARRGALIAALCAAVFSWDSPPEQADEVVAMCDHTGAQVYSGWRAYDAWIEDLRQNAMGTSVRSQHVRAVSHWNFGLLRRGRCQAAIYLRREARQFTGQQQNRLLRAADLYARFAGETSDEQLSPTAPVVDESSNAAVEAVRMLRHARQLDTLCMRELQAFLAQETP